MVRTVILLNIIRNCSFQEGLFKSSSIMIGQILKLFPELLCMFVILLMTSHHVLPSPLITNSTLHKRHISLDESENSHRNNNYDYRQQGYNYGGGNENVGAYHLGENTKLGLLGGALPKRSCSRSEDCNDDRRCVNSYCEDPCENHDCGFLKCKVENHQLDCTDSFDETIYNN